MRTPLAQFVASLALAAFVLPSFAAPPRTPQPQLPAQSPLELIVRGPQSINHLWTLPFKVQLRNRSSVPILVPAQVPNPFFSISWTISAPPGVDNIDGDPSAPVIYCPVTGFASNGDTTYHVRDSQLTILQPGDKLEFDLADVSKAENFSYRFPARGKYTVIFTYVSALPPAQQGGKGWVEFVLATYDLSGLSAEKMAALKQASNYTVTSEPFVMSVD